MTIIKLLVDLPMSFLPVIVKSFTLDDVTVVDTAGYSMESLLTANVVLRRLAPRSWIFGLRVLETYAFCFILSDLPALRLAFRLLGSFMIVFCMGDGCFCTLTLTIVLLVYMLTFVPRVRCDAESFMSDTLIYLI